MLWMEKFVLESCTPLTVWIYLRLRMNSSFCISKHACYYLGVRAHEFSAELKSYSKWAARWEECSESVYPPSHCSRSGKEFWDCCCRACFQLLECEQRIGEAPEKKRKEMCLASDLISSWVRAPLNLQRPLEPVMHAKSSIHYVSETYPKAEKTL